MEYDVTIGLEVHVQLKTQSKMFCGCSTRFGEAPNTQVCPVCLGYPGALPVMNEDAILLTVISGLMLGCEISADSRFDRKSYFYPDMPKNFQISQYDRPLCLGGEVTFTVDGVEHTVKIHRIHLEEDVAKSIHFKSSSGVDFNRAGVPLMEIVTEPDIHSPAEALAFLQALRRILLYADVTEGNLEEGNIRCDVNCSVSPAGSGTLGTKTELKNLNTSKGVFHSLEYEIRRQIDVYESGGRVVQETRRWDVDAGVTLSMRTKEAEHDYRYFPEPDLMPVVLPLEDVTTWQSRLPEMPRVRRARFMDQYGLPEYDAGVLVAEREVADYFEAAAALCDNPKTVSNWVMTEMLRMLSERSLSIADARITPQALASLIDLVGKGTVNSNTAKEIFGILFEQGGDPESIVSEKGLGQVSDASAIETLVDKAIADNPKSADDYRKGKTSAAKFLVGQVMRQSKGKANPQVVGRLVEEKLKSTS